MKYSLLIIVLFACVGLAQELNCKVTVNMEKLQSAAKDPLVGFQKTLEDYLNKTKFTPDRWEGGKIECSMNILFQTADNPNYTAQVIVSSQRPLYQSTQNSLMLNVNDGSWRFTYQKDQSLNSNQSIYDPITSFLDYYAYVIIGLDADSYDKLGGTRYFLKALDLVNLGATSAFSDGWQNSSASYSRRGLVEDLVSEKYRSFREAFYEYDNIRDKNDINTVLMKVFFDSKNGEMAESFKVYPNRDIYKTLKKIDPAHTKKYDDALFGE